MSSREQGRALEYRKYSCSSICLHLSGFAAGSILFIGELLTCLVYLSLVACSHAAEQQHVSFSFVASFSLKQQRTNYHVNQNAKQSGKSLQLSKASPHRNRLQSLYLQLITMQQDKDKDNDRKDGEDSWKKKDNDAAAAADALDENEEATEDKISVPTKTEDGGSSNGQADRIRSDAFSTYSDDNTRMLTLLGLDPNANPNEGEQVDWRQLTGFRGLRRRNNEDEAGNGTTPRRTRLSYELHPDVFWNMWFGDLDLNDDGHGQPERN